jgi:hypothetical protein
MIHNDNDDQNYLCKLQEKASHEFSGLSELVNALKEFLAIESNGIHRGLQAECFF